ncbi:MAG TPA: mycothiol synthase [Aquihabitans sp.]|nr:mycothiol synthase [Aquihabitans sp.]
MPELHLPDPLVTASGADVVTVGGVDLRYHRRGDDAEVELTGAGGRAAGPDLAQALVDALAALADRAAAAGATLHLAAEHPAEELDPLPEAVADAAGLTSRRDLLQLRRPLPVPADHPARAAAPSLVVRPFRPSDADAWLRVNNRAFASHPDQGRETHATLAQRTAEPWFDPAGFLVADDPARPGELAGSCWTKVHPATADDPVLGEIYVIGVDPSHRGEGLGPAFVLAGLDHLAGQGIGVANLYVEADNEPARRLYDRLGFTTHSRRRVYRS